MSVEFVQEAIPCLAIQGVYLRESQLTQAEGFDATIPMGIQFMAQHRAAPRSMNLVDIEEENGGHEHKLMNVYFSCGLRLIDPGRMKNDNPETAVVAEMTALFVAQYLILPGTKPRKQALDAFAKSNAGYHVWPYWREYAQSTCARSGLPVVAIPMYRVPKEKQSARSDKAGKSVPSKSRAISKPVKG